MSLSAERTLPYDINAEAAVLSAMMLDNVAASRALTELEDKFFYRTAHRIIFEAMKELYRESIEIDLVTIIDRLTRINKLDKIGGVAYVNEVSDVVLSTANIEYHIKIVTEKAVLRELIVTSNNIIENCYSAEDDVADIIDSAEQMIYDVTNRTNTSYFKDIGAIMGDTLNAIHEVASSKTAVAGTSTGYHDLDRMTGGFKPGQLIILAARPAMGKTALALNIAFNAVMYNNQKVAIFTMEMASEELLVRVLAAASEVPMDAMIKGFGMTEEKMSRVTNYAMMLSEKKLYIDDTGTNSPLDMRAKLRRLKAEIKGLDLVLIDYLQLMSSKRFKDNRQQEIAEISRSLKILAKELHIPVIALSQLNRGLESREDKRPKLSDLRESGAIEQDADLVMFLYRDEYYHEDTADKGIAEVIIGKNRHGAVGTSRLLFIPHLTAFRNIDRHNTDI
ncbi:MAG: replicative DNA helicase [Candidatus Cloacimonetes bacterium 4572_65]|nr:MAG: replicative DNA helicase [Candidatus Cloacimonetes bacterium 4572_65]